MLPGWLRGKGNFTKHIVCFSGGKDSTALLCWADEHLESYSAVFCDTVWEYSETYEYIREIFFQLKRCADLHILTLELWKERAAIMEFDAKLSKFSAEVRAEQDVRKIAKEERG